MGILDRFEEEKRKSKEMQVYLFMPISHASSKKREYWVCLKKWVVLICCENSVKILCGVKGVKFHSFF